MISLLALTTRNPAAKELKDSSRSIYLFKECMINNLIIKS